MNAERLLQHFDRIAEAPDAVAHLRRFILDLAVRGKLVQDDTDSVYILQQIRSEKERLVREGKIKKEKPRGASHFCDEYKCLGIFCD
jgi:type I restriction enzyme, S subunit